MNESVINLHTLDGQQQTLQKDQDNNVCSITNIDNNVNEYEFEDEIDLISESANIEREPVIKKEEQLTTITKK